MPFDVRDFPGAPPEDRAAGRRNRRLVASWLFVVAGMIFVMVVLGGITRLTGSGLSIMEWKPIEGILPPLNHADWEKLYRLYQQIPQYKLLHQGFGLDGFRRIFWLEWTHRLWGRLIGLAFLVPLVWFWATGRLERRLRFWLALLFLLGGLQGAVGWFMVSSGFFRDSTSVEPYRLVVHLALALVLYAAIVWTGLTVLRPTPMHRPQTFRLRPLAFACIGLLCVTIVAGGFVAGTHAGLDYNTFPLMDGQLVPADYARLTPFIRNFTENIAAVQFDHRLLATLTALTVAVTVIVGFATPNPLDVRIPLFALGLTAAVQYGLGVATLLLVVPVGLAAAHQANAVLLLTSAIVLLHALRRPRPAA
ncbi:MAG TPA: COX15/CtaA family protein [Acetobacteraceae bacterium]|nr:COX15/CtaA family protein [Acetobacteraceae bacterium]